MTWEEQLGVLFDDLEQQAAAAFSLEREVELAERSQAEYARVTLASRLMASLGCAVTLQVTGVGTVGGRLERVTASWCLVAPGVEAAGGEEWVVALAAVTACRGASGRSVAEEAWSPVTRLGLASALRGVGPSRCVVHTRDGGSYEGTPRRIGADFVELLVGEPGRGGDVVLVAFAALAAVQRRD